MALGTACLAAQVRWPMPRPWLLLPGLARRCMASTRSSAAYREQANVRTDNVQACGEQWRGHPMIHALTCKDMSTELRGSAEAESVSLLHPARY